MTYTFDIDPLVVLGLPPDASMEQIRDAYRSRSKKYHPDLGGDEWAFRILSRSYEILCRARVAGRCAAEAVRQEPSMPVVDPVVPRAERDAEGASVRSGVKDRVDHPIQLIDVELLLLRLEVENPYEVIGMASSDRNLSCNLDVAWPSALWGDGEGGPDPGRILAQVEAAFAATASGSRPTSSWKDEGSSSFRGWLSYPSAQACYDAFNQLRRELKARGLGVHQRIRELIIPRESR
ncbi:J domain-containing protein [Tautonia sociabilis]|uniref:J domain-containing protein n=1 Tax=Tautonia sociabilis TaxID=2080755 RepID=A0A432MQ46_9BACT|nr:J domain-containing protein [Tautonia sociabilis]RUL89594.1 J domain-containing protein [Tautonia sociabilis]